jgi:hypothetical protein
MNSDEEILWSYIDGNCTTEEHSVITNRIAADDAFRLKYNDLLKLNNEFSLIELDEPSMAFTYNVIEDIRALEAQKPLKATINKRIILGIAMFFVSTILGLLLYTLYNVNWSIAGDTVMNVPKFKAPDLTRFNTRPVIEGFLFFDLVLVLFFFDHFLRRKALSKPIN